MKWLLCAVLVAVVCFVQSEDEEARLLVSKNILNNYLVEGKDLTVEYSVYNVGGSSALEVQLSDDSFPESDFEVVAGAVNVQWERVGPGSNVSHIVVLRPLNSGFYNFTSAIVTYLPSDETTDTKFGYTSSPGEGGIVNFKDYDRKFSPHALDWAAFAVMTLPSLGIPFLLWYSSKSKYDNVKSKKN